MRRSYKISQCTHECVCGGIMFEITDSLRCMKCKIFMSKVERDDLIRTTWWNGNKRKGLDESYGPYFRGTYR